MINQVAILYNYDIISKLKKKEIFLTKQSIKIQGGKPLIGHIKAQGAKNAISKLLVASMVSDKKFIFHNVPNITEVDITLELASEIGMEFSWNREKKIIHAQTKNLKTTNISQRFSGANRVPILILGALIGRTKKDISVPIVGGDNLGKRPLNFHELSLKSLGCEIKYIKEKNIYLANSKKGLFGNIITLPYPSVGATENTILASITAKGLTTIKNGAVEPEVMDLILFLQKMGANITVDVNRVIYIQGTDSFSDVEHFVISDRNEVASYALAAISTKGKIFIEGANQIDMVAFLNKLREVGGGFRVAKDGIEFFYKGELKGGVHIETDVHPGFMTDWQQLFCILLTQCRGSSIIHETVYENRFGYIKTLKEMGADIELFTKCLGGKRCRFANSNYFHSAVIKGKTDLVANSITIPDLRAGFSYVMAALLAKKPSHISQIHFLDRGYENVVEKLSSLGADIERIGIGDRLEPFIAY